ncbi:hypothetical protein Droror1_Dr00003743 [Drosera rotundifolia]
MANPNDNLDNRRHEGNRFNQNTVLDWPTGYSFQEALAQPLRRDEVFHQWRDQGRHMVMPYGLPGSSTTFSQASEEQHYFEARNQSDPVSQSTEPTQTISRGSGWSIMEDKKLCYAWTRVSEDPIVGSNKKKGSFWKRIFNDFVNQHERAAHSLFKDQNNGRNFKLDHCWEILRECAKFTAIHGYRHATGDVPETVTNVARAKSFSASPSTAALIPNSTTEVEGEQNLIERNLDDQTSGDDLAHLANSFGLSDNLELELDNEESPTPTLGKRPPDRKASKENRRARKQKSSESDVGEKLVKTLEDLKSSTSAEWTRANTITEEEQQWGIKHRKLQMIREMIAIEREMIVIEYETNKLEKDYDVDARTSTSNPAEKQKRAATRRKRLEELHAEARALTAACYPNSEQGSSRRTDRNLNSSFDDEADQ